MSKIAGNEIRPGTLIEHDGGLWIAVKTQAVKPGKGGAYNQVELKNIISGTKLNERFRSDAAVDEIVAALAPDSDFDERRFRPTLVVDSPATSEHPEWDWCGGVLHGPHADLQPLIPTIRCVMPSHEQPQLKRDRDITRAIAAHSRRCLGVYGNVVKTGRIAEGDVLMLEPPARPATESGAVKVKRAVMRAVAAAIPNGRRN